MYKPGNNASKITNMTELGTMTADELSDRKIVHTGMQNKEALNAFREIRTQLLKKSNGRNFVATVTSVSEGSGSTLVTTNLGAVLALDKTKTALLVDCNLYNPGMGSLLDVSPDYGMTDYLAEDNLDINDIIYATGIPRLRVIPVGTQLEVGAEYFSSGRMSQFIRDLKLRYPDRFILLDVPPIGFWAEARILAELSDFSMLVVPYGKTTERQVVAAIDAIGKEKLAGMIFNH
jgi:Mrp family chromosome partitioning ATPase